MRRARARSLLRQAFVQRQQHCNFTPAELVAGLPAVQHRVETGRWDAIAQPRRLQQSALRLGLGEAVSVDHHPDRLSGDNGPFDPFT